MSTHIILLFEPDSASEQSESSVATELENAGYEVIEARNLSMAAALLFVSRTVKAVVVDVANDQIAAKFADSVNAIRPGLPVLRAASSEVPTPADAQTGQDMALVISTLEELFGQHRA
jgi:hypothetical protein